MGTEQWRHRYTRLETGKRFYQVPLEGYDEAMLLYILGLGSPTHPLPESSYAAWASTYRMKRCYDFDYLYAGLLFTHQLRISGLISEVFGMLSCVPKALITSRTADVRPTCSSNTPSTIRSNLPVIGACCWGISAGDGPGSDTIKVNGIIRQFYDYIGRGVPYGHDDGTLAPWAVVASLPFAPEIVLPVIDHFIHQLKLKSANPTASKRHSI